MKTLMGIVGLGLLLAGCVSGRDAEVDAAVQQSRDACVTTYRSKQLKTYSGYMQCLNTAEAPLQERAQRGGVGDLLNVKFAGRVAIAERVDRGEITPAQADFEVARMNSGLMSQGQNRLNANRLVDAATSPVTCNRYGNSVTCF